MRSIIQNMLNKTQFFKTINSTTYKPEKPSQILIRNIYINWLRYLNLKTHKSMPIYVHKIKQNLEYNTKNLPFGIIHYNEFDFKNKTFGVQDVPSESMDLLELKLIIPQQDYMQYFIQWQRYRKFWWSSITTTPSLFSIGDIKQGDNGAEADIVANLPSGPQTVEQITIKNYDTSFTLVRLDNLPMELLLSLRVLQVVPPNLSLEFKYGACLSCSMSPTRALFILLLDGLNNDAKDEYLRLHRKIAPYKMSFALSYEALKNKQTLKNLAALLFHRLNLGEISACLPDFSISLDEQIRKNLQMGIPYTAILDETTLQNGILHLMNSSTMLKEQIHVADFHTYAGLICSAK